MGCCHSGQQIHPKKLEILLETESISSDEAGETIDNVIEEVTMAPKVEISNMVRGESLLTISVFLNL